MSRTESIRPANLFVDPSNRYASPRDQSSKMRDVFVFEIPPIPSPRVPLRQYRLAPYWDPVADAAFSAAILASIFRLAARIISSRLFCSSDCRSSLLLLHAFLPAASPDSSSPCCCCLTLSSRLYLWIKFGCAGFSAGFREPGCDADDDAPLEPGGGGGWKVIGGWTRGQTCSQFKSLGQGNGVHSTYRLHPPGEYLLRRSRNAAPVAL